MIGLSLFLFGLGLCFGSFINATVWRIHEQSKKKKPSKALSITKGRSMCPHCRHELAAKDLIPVFSWLWLRGKCRYCHKPIDDSPIVELVMAAVFVISYLAWPEPLHGGQWLLLATWLACSVGLLALAIYDLKWMLLPNRLIYPTLLIAAVGQVSYILIFSDDILKSFEMLALSLVIASGLFWLIYIASKGKWIGFGDVRLGLVTGTLLADPKLSFLMIFGASVLGSIAAIPAVMHGKKGWSSKIPYGPFLIAATFIMLLFGQSIIDWYQGLFGL